MKRGLIVVSALAVACSLWLSSANAFGPACCKSKDAKVAKADSCTRTCGSKDEFPSMAMMVGDKSYDCCMSAGEAAKKAGTKVVYVVDGEKYECKDKATEALAGASEKFVNRFMTVACVADGKVIYCEESGSCSSGAKASVTCSKDAKAMAKADGKSCTGSATATVAKSEGCCKARGGKAMTVAELAACCKNAKDVKYMVMGRMYTNREEAVKARTSALKSVEEIHMTYLVDGKEVDCSSKVCPKAKADGKVQYIVNKEKTSCEASARIALAKAKYEAARNYAEKLAKI